MIGESDFYWLLTGSYALVAAGLLVAVVASSDDEYNRIKYLLVGMLVVSVAMFAAHAAEFGTYQPPGLEDGTQEQSIPRFINDIVGYSILFGLTTWFAGSSRRMIGLVAGLSVLSRIVIEAGAIFGIVGLAGLFSIGTYVARLYLLWGPVWRTAAEQRPTQRLLFWKARNMLMFLMGMNIVAALLTGAVVTDAFVQMVLIEYLNVCLRIGLAVFVIVNLSGLGTERGFDTVPLVGAD